MIVAINEIFFSIQGEGKHVGLPCVFVRLPFCNLRCNWCDTTYSFYEKTDYAIDDLLQSIDAYKCNLICITGGEPLLHQSSIVLMEMLCDQGKTVLLETSGSITIRHVDQRVHKIVDIKCPGSGMLSRNNYKNIEHLNQTDEVKFVIADRFDFDWAASMVEKYALHKICTVLFSPVFDQLSNQDLAEWILAERLPVRFQIQSHKYIWHPDQRGV